MFLFCALFIMGMDKEVPMPGLLECHVFSAAEKEKKSVVHLAELLRSGNCDQECFVAIGLHEKLATALLFEICDIPNDSQKQRKKKRGLVIGCNGLPGNISEGMRKLWCNKQESARDHDHKHFGSSRVPCFKLDCRPPSEAADNRADVTNFVVCNANSDDIGERLKDKIGRGLKDKEVKIDYVYAELFPTCESVSAFDTKFLTSEQMLLMTNPYGQILSQLSKIMKPGGVIVYEYGPYRSLLDKKKNAGVWHEALMENPLHAYIDPETFRNEALQWASDKTIASNFCIAALFTEQCGVDPSIPQSIAKQFQICKSHLKEEGELLANKMLNTCLELEKTIPSLWIFFNFYVLCSQKNEIKSWADRYGFNYGALFSNINLFHPETRSSMFALVFTKRATPAKERMPERTELDGSSMPGIPYENPSEAAQELDSSTENRRQEDSEAKPVLEPDSSPESDSQRLTQDKEVQTNNDGVEERYHAFEEKLCAYEERLRQMQAMIADQIQVTADLRLELQQVR